MSSGDVLYPGAAPCVGGWRRRGRSASRRVRCVDEIELMLRGGGLLDAFRFIVAAGDTERTKPAPDPYLRAAELHGVAPAACVAIEDSHWGLQSARAAGMTHHRRSPTPIRATRFATPTSSSTRSTN